MNYKIKARPQCIEEGIEPILEILEAHNVDHKTCYKVRLALDELLTNVVSYAYEDNEDGDIELSYEINESPNKHIVITISDGGKAFDPLQMEDPDLSINLADRKIGGLGLFIVRNTMDDISYRRQDNRNVLTIKKNI